MKEVIRSNLTFGKDRTRVMDRVKSIYRSRGIPYGGKSVYNPRHRDERLSKVAEVGVRRRAGLYYEQLDSFCQTPPQAWHFPNGLLHLRTAYRILGRNPSGEIGELVQAHGFRNRPSA